MFGPNTNGDAVPAATPDKDRIPKYATRQFGVIDSVVVVDGTEESAIAKNEHANTRSSMKYESIFINQPIVNEKQVAKAVFHKGMGMRPALPDSPAVIKAATAPMTCSSVMALALVCVAVAMDFT